MENHAIILIWRKLTGNKGTIEWWFLLRCRLWYFCVPVSKKLRIHPQYLMTSVIKTNFQASKQGNLSWSSGARIHENICKSRFDFYRQNQYSKNNIVGNYESSLEMVTSGTFAILMRYGYRKTESEKRCHSVPFSRSKRQKLPFEPSFFSYVKAAKFATFELKSSCLEMFWGEEKLFGCSSSRSHFLPFFRLVQLNSLFLMKSHLRRNTVLPIG